MDEHPLARLSAISKTVVLDVSEAPYRQGTLADQGLVRDLGLLTRAAPVF